MRANRHGLTALAVAALACVVAATAPVALGRFTDAAAVGTNSFTTAACWSAVESLQTGTSTSSANGTLTVPIAAVDMSRSFLVFSTRSNHNRPVGSTVRGRLATSTSLEFVRVTDEGAPAAIVISWQVVEYTCGVNVQRGATTLSATTVNVAITAVGSVNRAFATWSKTPTAADTSTDQNDALVAELTSTTNLQLRVNLAAGTHTVWWQVIEFTSAADILVQKGTTSLTGTATSTTATIPTPVDVGETFVIASFQTSGTGPDMGSRLLRAVLTNSTTITFDRSVSGSPDDMTEIHWQAVELSGARVQHGSEDFASGTATKNVPLTAVDTARAIAFASVAAPGGLSMGRSAYVGDDIPGVASATASVSSSTQLTLQRTNTAAAADIGWFVVQLR